MGCAWLAQTCSSLPSGAYNGTAILPVTAPTGPEIQRPNFLFFLPDQHRPDWVPWETPGAPALPLRMPHLAGIAGRGARFARAVCPSPLCAPSRACLASGREYDRCGVPDNGSDYPL